MKIHLLLKEMRMRVSADRYSAETIKNIKNIQRICNADYSDQRFYGNAALNRKILLDKRIAELLTPETILAILSLHVKTTRLGKYSKIAIWRNSTGYISLAAALYYGFSDGLETIQFLPNNEKHYDSQSYADQKQHFANFTTKVVDNIKTAAQRLHINIEDKLYQDETWDQSAKPLSSVFNDMVTSIDKIKRAKKNNQLLSVPGYSAEEIRKQSLSGFMTIAKLLHLRFTRNAEASLVFAPPMTLQVFIEQFLSSNDIMLNGAVSHLFYDRAHLEACLEQETHIIFGDKIYTLRDILREMTNAAGNASANPIAKEQFAIRFKLVKSDLEEHFASFCKDEPIDKLLTDPLPIGYREIENLISTIEKEIEIESWHCYSTADKLAAKNFLKTLLATYDNRKGQLPLSKCMKLTQAQDPNGYQKIIAREGLNFIFNILADKKPKALVLGPRRKNKATLKLEQLVHLLLHKNKSIDCKFNALNELEVIIDNDNIFNVTQILHNEPDFEQIELSDEQLKQYAAFVAKAKNKPALEHLSRFPLPIDYEACDPDGECDYLHYGEKLALTLYTTMFYESMQSFLRSDGQANNLQKASHSKLNQLVPEILLSISVAAHGLAKPIERLNTDVPYKRYFRKETVPNDASYFRQRLQAFKENQLSTEKGFLSTSTGTDYDRVNTNVYTIYHEYPSYNPFYKNIEAISHEPEEKEALRTPNVQLHYTDCVKIGRNHFFAARAVRSIKELKPNNYTADAIAWHELEVLDKTLETHLSKYEHSFLKRLFATHGNHEMLACLRATKLGVGEVLASYTSCEQLDKGALEKCQREIEKAIEINQKLVKKTWFSFSLGAIDKILQSAFVRIKNAINLMNTLEDEQNKPVSTLQP